MITFNSIDLTGVFGNDITETPFFSVIDITGRGPMSQEVTRIVVPKRSGSYYHSRRKPERILTVQFLLRGNSYEDLRTKVDRLNDILNVDQPVPITFSDEPNMVYYGIPEGEPSWEERRFTGKGTLTFICPDPYKYGIEYPHSFNSSGILELINEGTVDIFPTYEIDVTQDTTVLSIVQGENHITLGKPDETESVVVIERDLILYEKFESMTGWSSGIANQDGFSQMGAIYVNNGNFAPQNFGGSVDENNYRWRGPAYVKDLPRTVQDFYLECFMDMKSLKPTPAERAVELGRIAIWLLDINNKVIGKMFVEDPTLKTMMVKGLAKLGPEAATKTIMDYTNQAYNQFDGLITIQREGNWWYFQIGMYDTSTDRRYGRYNAQYYDADGTYQTKVAKIQVGFMQYKNYNFPSMLLDTMRFYELNGTGGITPEQVPVIAQAGDRLEIETSTGQIYRNGEPWYKRLDPTSYFFPIKPGKQTVHLYPNTVGTARAKVRRRWL